MSAEDEFIDQARAIIRNHSGVDVPRSSLGRVYDALLLDRVAAVDRVRALADASLGSWATDVESDEPLRNFVMIADLRAALDGDRP